MRVQGWEIKLKEFIDEVREQPFVWGSHDCGTFALKNYETLTGRIIEKPQWSSLREAIELMHRKPMCEWACTFFGDPFEGWKQARRGDVCLIKSPRIMCAVSDREALGVCIGAHIACPGEHRLEFIDVKSAIKTWRID